MAFTSKDGKRKFGSGFQAKRYDSVHANDMQEPTGQGPMKSSAKKPTEPKEESRTESTGFSKKSQPSVNSTSNTKGMHMGNDAPKEHEDFEESRTNDNGESTSPEEVVSQHGSAHTVTVHHDHTANKHHVMSHHKDGHMHESNHASAMEAHEHAKQLGSADADENKSGEPGEGEAGSDNEDLSSLFGGQ